MSRLKEARAKVQANLEKAERKLAELAELAEQRSKERKKTILGYLPSLTVPPSSSIAPFSARSNVVLPAPFSPMIAIRSPG